MTTPKPSERGRGQTLIVVGAVLYVVAWFVPVWRGQDVFGSAGGLFDGMGAGRRAGPGMRGLDWLPGWQACTAAFEMMIESDSGGDGWKRRIAGSTCLCNLVMIGALLARFARRDGRGFGLSLLCCFALATSWIWLLDENPFDVLAAGYWAWLVSFALVGVGLIAGPRSRR